MGPLLTSNASFFFNFKLFAKNFLEKKRKNLNSCQTRDFCFFFSSLEHFPARDGYLKREDKLNVSDEKTTVKR